MKKRWIGMLACLVIGQVQAASFDCAKATTKIEKLICADAGLSRLDEELAAAYREALTHARLAGAEEVKQEQKLWLKEYRNRCTDTDCLKREYQQRMGRIAVQIGTPKAPDSAESAPPAEGAACLQPKIDWRNYTWTLITGKGMAACEDMLAWLKSRPREAPPPVCPEERLPPNGNWTRPETRILSEEEKQALIRDMPEKWRKFYEGPFKRAQLMRAIRGDITRDGIPETLLAYSSNDYRQTCKRATQCAKTGDKLLEGDIAIGEGDGDYYHLLPMTETGTQVDWSHRTVGATPMLMMGELVYYKRLPYWLSMVAWFQSNNDEPTHSIRTDDPYNAMFGLYEFARAKPTPFKDVRAVGIFNDPEDQVNPGCRFGYFRREALDRNRCQSRIDCSALT